jgi:hypothetical protein
LASAAASRFPLATAAPPGAGETGAPGPHSSMSAPGSSLSPCASSVARRRACAAAVAADGEAGAICTRKLFEHQGCSVTTEAAAVAPPQSSAKARARCIVSAVTTLPLPLSRQHFRQQNRWWSEL